MFSLEWLFFLIYRTRNILAYLDFVKMPEALQIFTSITAVLHNHSSTPTWRGLKFLIFLKNVEIFCLFCVFYTLWRFLLPKKATNDPAIITRIPTIVVGSTSSLSNRAANIGAKAGLMKNTNEAVETSESSIAMK